MGSWCEAEIKSPDDVSYDLLQVSILWSSEGKNQALLLNDLLRSRLREQLSCESCGNENVNYLSILNISQ